MPIQTDPIPELPGLTIRRFRKEDSLPDFERAMQVRTEVFIEEQNVPAEEEQDDEDETALHWLILNEAEQPVATGRFIAYQEGCQMRPVAKIGRIAVKKSMRSLRLGNFLIRDILHVVREEEFDQAILDAQTQALPFYEKLGFVAEGDEFIECAIPHVRMRLILS